jgi:hypothetical protein
MSLKNETPTPPPHKMALVVDGGEQSTLRPSGSRYFHSQRAVELAAAKSLPGFPTMTAGRTFGDFAHSNG